MYIAMPPKSSIFKLVNTVAGVNWQRAMTGIWVFLVKCRMSGKKLDDHPSSFSRAGWCTVLHAAAAVYESPTNAILWSVQWAVTELFPFVSQSAICLMSKIAGDVLTVFVWKPNQEVVLNGFPLADKRLLITCFPERHVGLSIATCWTWNLSCPDSPGPVFYVFSSRTL